MEQVIVSGSLGRKNQNRQQRNRKLQVFGTLLFSGNGALAPGRGGAPAQTRYASKREQVKDRPEQREKHHRDANAIEMNAIRETQRSRRERESPNSH